MNCPKCAKEMPPGYDAKTLEELLQRKRPDFWICQYCRQVYEESQTGQLKKSSRYKFNQLYFVAQRSGAER